LIDFLLELLLYGEELVLLWEEEGTGAGA
jgi:hypothetical protein